MATTDVKIDGVTYKRTLFYGETVYKLEKVARTKIPKQLEIPAFINDYPVVIIGDQAFLNCFRLEEISIPDTIQSIQVKAFYNCNSLRLVKTYSAAQNVAMLSVCRFAFANCYKLEKIDFGGRRTSTSNQTFVSCHMLTEINAMFSNIGSEVFEACHQLTTIVFDDNAVWCTNSFAWSKIKTLVFKGKICDRLSPTTVKAIQKKKIKCTEQFQFLDWMYSGTNIEIIST